MFVKPASGLLVRDPITFTPLPAEGREVGESFYWHRRLRDGDVVLAEPREEPAPAPAPSSPQAAPGPTPALPPAAAPPPPPKAA